MKEMALIFMPISTTNIDIQTAFRNQSTNPVIGILYSYTKQIPTLTAVSHSQTHTDICVCVYLQTERLGCFKPRLIN